MADGNNATTVGIDIGLDDQARQRVIATLNTLLADEVLLYLKTRNFHWNVEGPSFFEHHKFFEEQYETLDEVMDDVAERARAIDGRAAGSMAEFVRLARLKESPPTLNARQMLATLLADHEILIRHLRTDAEAAGEAGDSGTEDFLVGVMEGHEKMAWMLRAYLR